MSNFDAKIVDLASAVLLAARRQALKKCVFSKHTDKTVQKTVITLKSISGRLYLQAESFYADNKARHENIALSSESLPRLCELIGSCMQVNLITTAGECEYKASKSGKITLIGVSNLVSKLNSDGIDKVQVGKNNNEKNYIITADAPFLQYLGVSDKNGRIHDKKQSKFRQINKFVENVRDIYPHLPKDGALTVYDLCCGKSYLSFAVYHYLKNVMGRDVKMYGVDLKADVIEYCNTVARDVGFDGLSFYCADITKYECKDAPDLVISLHACDIATDIVLDKAIKENAKVILSTPCCHHELNHKIKCKPLSFVTEHSMLRQKLCDAATDALRLKRLEANNYSVVAVELIDPEETPKNILLRAFKKPATPANLKRCEAARQEYEAAKLFLLGEI